MSYCNKCGKCCNNIAVHIKTGKMYRDGIQTPDENFMGMLILQKSDSDFNYYRCKFLNNNLCTNINKPQECTDFPSSAFAFLDEECGYRGMIFQSREKITQKIRKLKEEIVHYNSIICTSNNKAEKLQYTKIIESHKRYISKYAIYGSDDW